MKIVFDIDGTLTNYNEFVKNKAIPYIKSKYQLEVINPNALEIEDVFDIENHAILNDFWYKKFMCFLH